jgi:hypothetical protein
MRDMQHIDSPESCYDDFNKLPILKNTDEIYGMIVRKYNFPGGIIVVMAGEEFAAGGEFRIRCCS